MRVFHDRLATNDDWEWVKTYILELIEEQFKEKLEYKDIFEEKQIIFGNYMKRGLPHSDWKYEEVTDYQRFEKVMSEYVEEYNIEYPNAKLELVLFKDALNHISRISWIL